MTAKLSTCPSSFHFLCGHNEYIASPLLSLCPLSLTLSPSLFLFVSGQMGNDNCKIMDPVILKIIHIFNIIKLPINSLNFSFSLFLNLRMFAFYSIDIF